jgi:hypothetical protein
MVRGISLVVMVLACSQAAAGCTGAHGGGCPGSVTASLTGVIAAGAAGGRRGVALPPGSRAVITLGGTVGWKAQRTGTVIDNKKASGDLPPPATTTSVDATTTTTGVSFGPTTAPFTLPPVRTTPEPAGRPFTATTTIGNQTLTVKGAIIGPPAPCHGIGSWTLASPDNRAAGGGSWSF